ncbi:unnamed protein product [Phaedon cochleariae]|uniref:Peptidase S1 domain-containing protein n=1 Tax=Phaedon cochleariae TaxID=80249 RepID=A0A9P0DX98_PHACE|nr:unnamed protein product [Phaedon cochleariae]
MSKHYKRLLPIVLVLIFPPKWMESSSSSDQAGSELDTIEKNRTALKAWPTIQSGECGEHSFMASIQIAVEKRRWRYCTGTLLHRYWVLTTARCVKKFRTLPILAVFGLHNEDFVKPFSVRIMNKFLKIHPNYNGDQHDIALLKLASPLENIGRVVIPRNRSNDDITKVCRKGLTMAWDEPGTLECLITPSLSLTECRKIFLDLHIWDMQFCIRNANDTENRCLTQTGGAFMCRGVQHGIFSQGSGCGDVPGVYTRIDHYLDFIWGTINRAPRQVVSVFFWGVLVLMLCL